MKTEIRKKIDSYGIKVDDLILAHEYNDLKLLLDEMEQFAKKDVEIKDDVPLNYYLGTGFGTYADHMVRSGSTNTDPDVIELRRRSIFYFRNAISLNHSLHNRDSRLKLRILTNYANELNTIGRVIEALRIYREVLKDNNSFSIALGNYGRALRLLANLVNDVGHCNELHSHAYQAIQKALTIKDLDLHEQAICAFQRVVNEYEALPAIDFLSKPIKYEEYDLGDTEEERAYRKWCLRNHLFLNPLNEVIETSTAFAHDPLTIIRYTEDINASDAVSGNPAEPPRWFAMLNQLKEEYVYARYLCYSGSEMYGEIHFADRDVELLLASFDYPVYSIRLEQLKSSFRILYSMFDQICFFVNDFWEIGLKERKADANNICRSQNYPQNNTALNSLYWVLCEFFEKFGEANLASEKDLKILRNALEHKYVKVHEYKWDRKLQLESDSFYHISEDDLKKHTMRLLLLSREALMYLIYAIGVDDRKKQKADKVVTMPLAKYPDEWKR